MLIKTKDKWDAAKSVINLWLADQTLHCNNCGEKFNADLWKEGPCCEEPEIGRNMDHLKGVINENKRIREQAKNDYSANDDKNLRIGLAMPPSLLLTLEDYFKKHGGEKLFRNNQEMHSFMKKFPMLCTARKV